MGNLRLANVSNNLESCLDTVIVDLPGLDSLHIVFAREPEHIKGILASDGDKLAALGPVNVLGLNLDSTDKTASSPVEE